MNLLAYIVLVYGRSKMFHMHAMKAYKSLKAYRFFADGFVQNHGVAGSLSSTPLDVFLALNGETGDMYSVQCNHCVPW